VISTASRLALALGSFEKDQCFVNGSAYFRMRISNALQERVGGVSCA
jgi:hypothetical protein